MSPPAAPELALRTADVLLVEDDDGDVLLTTEAFERFARFARESSELACNQS
jgi:hypothetical protein